MFHGVDTALELAVIFIRLIVLENAEISSTSSSSSSDALAAMSAGQAVNRRATPTQPDRQMNEAWKANRHSRDVNRSTLWRADCWSVGRLSSGCSAACPSTKPVLSSLDKRRRYHRSTQSPQPRVSSSSAVDSSCSMTTLSNRPQTLITALKRRLLSLAGK